MDLRKVFSFATLTLIVALALSTIAAWYSIQGLVAIFAAMAVPVMVMGGSLEIAKVVTTLWLHKYWHRSNLSLKLYLIPAVVVLALLTSMGTFGYLSKAHSDQTLVSGDVMAKLSVYDEQISIAKTNIETNKKTLEQMNAQVDQLLTRTTDDKGVNRAVSVRSQQKAERVRIQQEIAKDQATITKLNEEAAPIRAEIRKLEAEVGPIKYIAALIYGDNPDTNLLERAVRYVIILIVLVFDPLALVLMLAAQNSYRWLDEDLKNKKEENFTEAYTETKDTVERDLNLAYDIEDYRKVDDDAEIIHTDDVDADEPSREDIHESTSPVTDAPRDTMDKIEVKTDKKPQPVIDVFVETENVTLPQNDAGYVQFGGKSVSKEALKSIRPDLFASLDSHSKSSFGIEFPKIAKRGDTYVRVDVLPNRVFKFDGQRWIEVNKSNIETYLHDEEYLRYLIAKLESGEYDIELLSDTEVEQIELFLKNNKS